MNVQFKFCCRIQYLEEEEVKFSYFNIIHYQKHLVDVDVTEVQLFDD